ncbi:zinc-finger-containing protein [Methylotenera sp.]|uniref:zinc-finger-containing protein n=1 Tax=Methylotenera sp. TaxID=2051956 RepID=UPI002ED90A92
MRLFCCQCDIDVEARLTDGMETYPHREDLYDLPFWKCDACRNFVGCHHKTSEPNKPLGCIPSAEVKELRKQIHANLDPLWMDGKHSRKYIYARLTEVIGREYHTADIRNATEASLVIKKLNQLKHKIRTNP